MRTPLEGDYCQYQVQIEWISRGSSYSDIYNFSNQKQVLSRRTPVNDLYIASLAQSEEIFLCFVKELVRLSAAAPGRQFEAQVHDIDLELDRIAAPHV